MNIDKDIEIVKEIQKELGLYADGTKIRKSFAIKNVLSELESYRGKIVLSDEEYNEVIGNAQKDIKKELETWKKIAEKLAEKADELDINCYCADILPKDWDCVKYKNCKECIIDWARNEVEKDE